ncbi:MAG TPA: sulfite exporter TauE/SafE family protein, partial [Terracidiphilus sp.]
PSSPRYNELRMSHLHGFSSSINWRFVWLVIAAFLAGAINAVAGGGSFLSFPALLAMRILPVQANATNTVAIWPGQLTSIAAYREDVRKNSRSAWLMGIAGLLGGTTGAAVLLNTPQRTFMHLVPWLLFGAACIFAVSGPVSRGLERLKLRRREEARAGHVHSPHRVALFVFTMLISFYVGYFGAGAGFLLLTMLALIGYEDMHAINALKIVANMLANGSAFLIFVLGNHVVWRYGLPALIACATGGYVSARHARRVPQRILRTGVVILGLSMAAWFFWHQS